MVFKSLLLWKKISLLGELFADKDSTVVIKMSLLIWDLILNDRIKKWNPMSRCSDYLIVFSLDFILNAFVLEMNIIVDFDHNILIQSVIWILSNVKK